MSETGQNTTVILRKMEELLFFHFFEYFSK